MKKILLLFCCLAMVLTIFGGCETAPKEHTLRVGFGRVLANPDMGVPLAGAGTGDSRISDKIVDDLYVTCIALTDETDNTILMYSEDLLYAYNGGLRKVIEATGVPFENIMIAATHNHSAPGMNFDHEGSYRYQELYNQWMVDAAVAAMEDRKPAKMYITTTYPENVNFVRHYILNDGSKVGQMHATASTAVSHLYKADNALQLIKFTREGGKDVLLMNWQGHPGASSSGTNNVGSDVDVIRKKLEPELDCYLAYFLGASGDVAHASKVKAVYKAEWYLKDYVARCTRLAECTVEAAASFREVKTGPLQILRKQGLVYPLKGETEIYLNLAAYTIGDVAFAAVPYEMFGPNGSAVKDASEFEMTFISTCTNGGGLYIPAAYAFEYEIPCYEVKMNSYRPGSAETLEQYYIEMLAQVYPTRFGGEK